MNDVVWLAVDEDGTEAAFDTEFTCRLELPDGRGFWQTWGSEIDLPKGTIEKLIGRKLTWEDEPVEYR